MKATIDIGTNTAHLLIGEIENGKLVNSYKERIFTYLAEDGIEHISDQAIGRLMGALLRFKSKCDELKANEVIVIATEGLRKANNSQTIIDLIHQELEWKVRIISGEQEANYIVKGAMSAFPMHTGEYLVMDIGGGSVEFIYVSEGVIKGVKSLSIGIANLYNDFHHSDPYSIKSLNALEVYLDEQINQVLTSLNVLQPKKCTLVGCAGTFEIFLDQEEHQTSFYQIIPAERTAHYYDALKLMDIQSRRLYAAIPPDRAKYIIEALALISVTLKNIAEESYVCVRAALKEGILLSQ